jgi:hypothetical protein
MLGVYKMKVFKILAIVTVISTPLLMTGCVARVYDSGYHYGDVRPMAPAAPIVYYDGYGGNGYYGGGRGFYGGGRRW